MKQSFLANERIYLRAVEPEDLDLMYEMENDPSMWDMFADKQLRLMIMRRKDNCTLGTVDITDFVPLHSRGAVGIAVHSNYRQEGYASDALKLLCEYAFNFLFIKQLYAHIAVDNEPSLRLFNSCGFTQCGVLKEWLLTHEGYKDAVLVQCMNPKR